MRKTIRRLIDAVIIRFHKHSFFCSPSIGDPLGQGDNCAKCGITREQAYDMASPTSKAFATVRALKTEGIFDQFKKDQKCICGRIVRPSERGMKWAQQNKKKVAIYLR